MKNSVVAMLEDPRFEPVIKSLRRSPLLINVGKVEGIPEELLRALVLAIREQTGTEATVGVSRSSNMLQIISVDFSHPSSLSLVFNYQVEGDFKAAGIAQFSNKPIMLGKTTINTFLLHMNEVLLEKQRREIALLLQSMATVSVRARILGLPRSAV